MTEPHGEPPVPDPDCLDCVAWVKVRDDARAIDNFGAAAIASTELHIHRAKCARQRERAT